MRHKLMEKRNEERQPVPAHMYPDDHKWRRLNNLNCNYDNATAIFLLLLTTILQHFMHKLKLDVEIKTKWLIVVLCCFVVLLCCVALSSWVFRGGRYCM
jgi:hypothetical protein